MGKKRNQIAAAVTAAFLLLDLAAVSGCAEEQTTASGTNGVSQETMQLYRFWKTRYVTQDTYVTTEPQYYVYYSEEHYAGDFVSVPVTVSEAHGYGMLIFAGMAAYDPQAKSYFDGMYRYFKAHPSDIGPHLMSWQQCDNGSSLIDGAVDGSMTGGESDSATDGDMDIAYALLAADAVWGSNGDIDYLGEAKLVIQDIMQYDVNHEFWTLTLGDWVSQCDTSESYYHATRSSDFIMQYLPVFAEVSGDANWMKVYDTTYQIIEEVTAENGTGLLPDFIVRNDAGTFEPAPANFLESDADGMYSYNSCRTPWRIGLDGILTGNKTAKQFAQQITAFLLDQTGGDPMEIKAGYTLDGTAIEDYDDLCFIAPFLTAAACAGQQTWHDQLRQTIVDYGDDVYYGDTIRLLCLMADDGGWPMPAGAADVLLGDVNGDGTLSLADLVLLQKYLLHQEALKNWAAGDLNGDGGINGLDLAVLKQNCI